MHWYLFMRIRLLYQEGCHYSRTVISYCLSEWCLPWCKMKNYCFDNCTDIGLCRLLDASLNACFVHSRRSIPSSQWPYTAPSLWLAWERRHLNVCSGSNKLLAAAFQWNQGLLEYGKVSYFCVNQTVSNQSSAFFVGTAAALSRKIKLEVLPSGMILLHLISRKQRLYQKGGCQAQRVRIHD